MSGSVDNSIPALEDIEREIALRGKLIDFVEMTWSLVEPGSKFIRSWHIEVICDHLEAVSRGDIRRLVINVPPGTMKSLLVCVFWPVWEWVRNPGCRWIFTSFDSKLTKRDAERSLAILQSDWFRKRFREQCLVADEVSAIDYGTHMAGWRFATSVDGKTTGRHADIQVVDDPSKPSALTKIELEHVRSWLKNTMATRWRNAGEGRRVIIMQRLHELDLSQLCIDEGYVLLRFPMEYEPDAACYTKWGGDMRTELNELLCPERFDRRTVDEMKREMGAMVTAAQFQQRPVPEGGAIFKREWFKTYKDLPLRFDKQLLSVDCAFKGTDSSDYVVIQVWGVVGADFYLIDQFREKVDFNGTLHALRTFIGRHPKARAILIEDKANGPAVITSLEKDVPGIIAINPEGGKEARAHAVSPFFESGNVYFPEQAGWLGDMISEFCAFPMGRNDDQVDACTQALNYLHSSTTRLAAAMRKLRGE